MFYKTWAEASDNAANMSGIYSGLQMRIKQINPLVEWVPCSVHTLNLVGLNSVNCCLETEEFFNFVQTLLHFSSKSTSRWQTIKAGLEPNDDHRIETLKSLSDTQHTRKQQKQCTRIIPEFKSLQKLGDDSNQSLTARDEARMLYVKMEILRMPFCVTCGTTYCNVFTGLVLL